MAPTAYAHYRVDSRLGVGGMGEVFRAFDTRLNRPIAIKVLRATGDGRALSIERFLREARAASALNHPNIVVIHDVGETDDGEHYIVQELIEGRTLRSMLAPGEPAIPLAMLVDVGSQTARALAAAHAAGLMHRDVKPENIMLRADGFVKVLDFGLARMTGSAQSSDRETTHLITAPGVLIGTPGYIAPEQAKGEETGPPIDVFALGVILYEMATGRRPFGGATPFAVIANIISEQPPRASHLNPAIPRALDDLLMQMLEKDPAARPTAREVERQLSASTGTILLGDVVMPSGGPARATVGRDAQRAQLLRAFARVKAGRSLIVGVSGEPGIGKTSLVEDFLADLAVRGEHPTIARGRCSESLAGSEAFLPVLEVLDSLMRRTDGPSLHSIIKVVAPTWYLQIATDSTETTSIGEMRERTPAGSQERMKRELGALLQEVSRQRPLVLFIDDLHWADVSTIDVLNYLAGRLADLRVMIVTNYRPSDMAIAKHPFLGVRSELLARGDFEELELRFLEVRDVERYLELQFPGHAFSPDFAAAIHAKTDGNPLFMADLVRYLHDTGGIVEESGRWVVARGMPDVPKDLPESVKGMIARNIERLDDRNRRLLLAASVQGHKFDSAVIAEAAEMDPAEVEERLETLERVHVFVTRGDEYEFPDRTLTLRYRFVHVLYQNVLYASLQPTRRATLSRTIVQALLTRYGSEAPAIAGRLALLFETARDFASSAKYFLMAARKSMALFAFREALTLADRGLTGLRGLPEGVERTRLELGLQMSRGLALRSVRGWAAPELETTFARARQLAHDLQDPPEIFPVLWSLTFFHMIRGDLVKVRHHGGRLLAQAEASGRAAFMIGALHIGGVSREFMGELVEASRMLERARELHDLSEHRALTAMYGIDPGMQARSMSARPLWALGYPDLAVARSRETIEIGRSQRQRVTFVFAMIVAQGIHLYRGEAREAIALGDEILALCHEYQFPQEAEWARAFQGSAHAQLGETELGIGELRQSLVALQALGSDLVRTVFLALLGDAALRAGRVDEGHTAIDEAFAHAEKTTERGFLAEMHRVRGELFASGGNGAAAEEQFRTALAIARQQEARSFELRTATALARLLASSGRRADAHEALAPAYGWFTEGFGTRDLIAARALLAEVE